MANLYRYDSNVSHGIANIYLRKFPIIRATEKGNWVNGEDGTLTFCLEGSGKRFAHTSRELAFDSFKHRKNRRYIILQAQLDTVEAVRQTINSLKGKLPDEAKEWQIGH